MTLPLAQPEARAEVGGLREPAAPPPRSSRIAARAACTLAALIALVGLWQSREFYHDDAFITLRYAQRLLHGDGLTWNVGERVEGFSNPLWLFQAAGLGALGMDLVDATRLLGALYLVALFALWKRARAWPVALLLVASQPGLTLWARAGLETMSFAFWVVAGAWLAHAARAEAVRREPGAVRTAALAGLAFAALALTRPEGAGVAVVGLVWIASARQRGAVLASVAVFGILAGAYLGFRFLYFGDWAANPAYAKLGGLTLAGRLQGGWDYLWLHRTHWIPAMLASLIVMCLQRTSAAWGVLLMSAPLWALIVMAGGDQMVGGRLIIPAVVLAAFAVALDRRAHTRTHRLVMTAVVCGAVLVQGGDTVGPRWWKGANSAAAVGTPVGRFLAAHLPAGASVALATAGSVPYFAPTLSFIDTLGLNDKHIARREVPVGWTRRQDKPGHHKGDGRYVLDRRPDVIILGPAQGVLGDDPEAWWLTEFELLGDPEFQRSYTPYSFPVPVTEREAGWARVQALTLMVRPGQAFRLVAYLRDDSAVAKDLRAQGVALRRPGEKR